MRSLRNSVKALGLMLLVGGCTPQDIVLINTADRDGDGFTVLEGDCNDYDACVLPYEVQSSDDTTLKDCPNLAEDKCNDIDDNCNGQLDEDAIITTYLDGDQDGYGDPSTRDDSSSCASLQNNRVRNNDDCNDGDVLIHPNADEFCDVDDVDENCDGNFNTDPLAEDLEKFLPDRDLDGYGDENAEPVLACNDPTNYDADYVVVYLKEEYARDCNDENEFINPDATETCDYTDNNCDGVIDEGFNADSSGSYCTPQEVCDGIDNNGNGKIDEGYDVDSDGYTSEQRCKCLYGSGVTCGTDCDDNKASVNPTATEQCDEADNDCDGTVDETERDGSNESYLLKLYLDFDGDGFGKAGTDPSFQCVARPDQSIYDTDCNDDDVQVYPGSNERCDGVDNNCNGIVDEDVPYYSYYRDADNDGVGVDPTYGGGESTEYPIPAGAPAFLSTCKNTSELLAQYNIHYAIQGNILDCDDYNPDIFPGQKESCNFIDDDCTGKADEVEAVSTSGNNSQLTEYVIDADHDTYPSKVAYGIPAVYTDDDATEEVHVLRCQVAEGNSFLNRFRVWNGFDKSDCLDSLEDDPDVIEGVSPSTVKPGVSEQCNGYDDDCNGTIDNNADFRFWYLDLDKDGYGALTDNAPYLCDNPYKPVDGEEPVGYVELHDCHNDINDMLLGVMVDGECVPIDESVWFDCNDSVVAIHSYQKEVCSNDIDDNCDGYIDRLGPGKSADDPDYGILNNTTWYKDDDRDGFGRNDSTAVPGCTNMPYSTGYVLQSVTFTNNSGFDCKDDSSLFNPAAYETCDGQSDPALRNDENCNGTADEDSAVNSATWYRDSDGDGYGNSAVTTKACYKPTGYVSDFTDCQDNESRRNPGATETCDGIDNNCNGSIDEGGAGGASTYYKDADADTFGNPAIAQAACVQPSGYVSNSQDCDDSNPAIRPTGIEVCDPANADEDCDGAVDDADSSFDRTTARTYYIDSDSDGFGKSTGSGQKRCDPPSDGNTYAVDDKTDCDDTDPTINPQARETAGDGVDQNCDLSEICYLDNDNDGYRPDATSTIISTDKDCLDSREAAETIPVGDCNDSNAAIKPRATETAADGVDSDCDGKELCYKDSDGDGYRPDSTSTVVSSTANSSGTFTCLGAGEAGSAVPVGDCRDDVATINPAASETVGNSVDDNCNGTESCFTDADDDGYRPNSTSTVTSPNASCADSGEAVLTDPTGDCNDANAAINPAATEITADAVDQNCDSKEVCFADLDNDGYRPNSTATVVSPDTTCNGSSEASSSTPTGDCNDNNSTINPGATEVVANGVDDNCAGGEVCYADADNDGYRALADATVASTDGDCADSGEALASEPGGDCNDAASAVKPGATEAAADSVDQNCDGLELCYADFDNDGYRPDSTSTVLSSDTDCADAREAVSADPTTDCDDLVAAIHPGVTETTGDGVDYDCNGQETCYKDADNDDRRPSSTATQASTDTDCTDSGEALATDLVGDCNDSDAAIYLGATEACDSKDNDCNGVVDDNAGNTYVIDSDGDTYGSNSVSAATKKACSLPSGYSTTTTDCDDSDAAVFPGGTDHCGDGKDGDCNPTGRCIGALPSDANNLGVLSGTSTATGAMMGYAIAHLDTLSDGTERWAVSAPAGYSDGSGAVYIFDGPNVGGSMESSPLSLALTIHGELLGDEFGAALSAGDFDGDSNVDLAVGAPGYDVTGAVYVVMDVDQLVTNSVTGTEVASATAPFIKITGVPEATLESPFERLGSALAMNGNFVGSPGSDLIVGDPLCDGLMASPAGGCVISIEFADVTTCSGTGECIAACVAKVVGSGAGDLELSSTECSTLSSPVSNSFSSGPWGGAGPSVTTFGSSVAYLSNIQGSGGGPNAALDEIVVGVPAENKIAVYSSIPSGGHDDDVTIPGPSGSGGFGFSLYSTPGSLVDASGSTGVRDLIVGAVSTTGSNGRAYLMAGELLLTHNGSSVNAIIVSFAETSVAQFGRAAIATKVNSDSSLDLVIGAPGTPSVGAASAAAFVYYGPFTGNSGTLTSESTWDLELTAASGSGFGFALGTAQDSIDRQLVVGAPFNSSNSGVFYTFDLAIPTN